MFSASNYRLIMVGVAAVTLGLCVGVSSIQSASRQTVSLEPVCVYGGEDGPEDHILFRVIDFAVTHGGEVLAADYKLHTIKRYAPNGHLLARIGIEGAGPGDLNRPTALIVEPSGNIVVFDSGNRRLQRLRPTGEYVHSSHTDNIVQELQLDSQGRLYGRVMERPVGPPTDPQTLKLVRFAHDLSIEMELDEMTVQLNTVAGSAGSYSVTQAPYPPSLEWAVLPDDRIVVGHSNEGRIRIFRADGTLGTEFELEGRAPELTDADKRAFLALFEVDGQSRLAPELLDALEFPDHLPRYTDIAVDAEGRLLIRRADKEGLSHFDVYRPTGDHAGEIAMTALPDKIKFQGSSIYALHAAPEDLPTIVRYDRVGETGGSESR